MHAPLVQHVLSGSARVSREESFEIYFWKKGAKSADGI